MLKTLSKSLLHYFGFQLIKVRTEDVKHEADNNLWLKNLKIKTILDIGANTGQFAQKIHQIFPDSNLYSFEPLPDCYDELTKSFKNVPQFKAFNLALGSEAGKIEMHRSEYSLSSSILPMAELHKASFPFTRNETIQEIDVVRLDDMAVELELFEPILIKLDVQGFEDKVIEGGKDVFSRANIVITEMSVEELYKGQKLFDDIYRILVDFGFVYRGNYEQLFNPHDGRVLQVDGIFVRK